MIGALIGDLVGSRFEFHNHRSKNFELFSDDCFVTDDSIMTLSVAKALMETEKQRKLEFGLFNQNDDYYELLEEMTIKYMQEIGRKYPYCGYGNMFSRWVFTDDPLPYDSYGNGAAMRISPAGFAGRTESEVSRLSKIITGVSHNHEEGIKGAEATALAIFMARSGYTKHEIGEKIRREYYPLDFTIDEIRYDYQFNETCQETVPQAIEAFLESTSFEDAIRTAISVGGDSDTLAAITGSIAEAYYGVPSWIREKALSYLDEELLTIYNEWQAFLGLDAEVGRFHVLTKYIGDFSELASYVEFMKDSEDDAGFSFPFQMSISDFNAITKLFVDEFYQFQNGLPEFPLNDPDLLTSDALRVLARIKGTSKTGGLSYDTLPKLIEEGTIQKWLQELKSHEQNERITPVEEIYFENGGYSGFDTYHVHFSDESARLVEKQWILDPLEIQYPPEETKQFLDRFKEIHVEYWKNEYTESSINTETHWYLAVKLEGSRGRIWRGSSAYPANWSDLLTVFGIESDTDEEMDEEYADDSSTEE